MTHCGKQMIQGKFVMEKQGIPTRGSSLIYPVATFYSDGEKLCECPIDSTIGYYCPECGMMIGVFPVTHPKGFAGRFNADLDDKVDSLPKKICPDCGTEIDMDYPKCPVCGFIYETI